MPFLYTGLTRESAEDYMAKLVAANVPAKISYNPGSYTGTVPFTEGSSMYSIFVEDEDLEEAQEALRPNFVKSVEVTSPTPIDRSPSIHCPKCASHSINYPVKSPLPIIYASIPFLMLPLIGWVIWRATTGSLKICANCGHTWRSKP